MDKNVLRRCAAGCLAAMLLMTTGCGAKEEPTGFQPKLDTKASVQLDVAGFFGNFEALDQVTNDFNQYYPNVIFNYQQVSGEKEEAYLEANPGIDIFMTGMTQMNVPGSTLPGRCIDLAQAGVDTGDLDGEMLKLYTYDGKLAAIPMGQSLCGIVANLSLLEKESLAIPTDTHDFLDVCAALKEKGYTPIQGPTSKVYSELIRGAAFSMLCSDEKLLAAAKEGSDEAVAALKPTFDFLSTVLEKGYTDPAINEEYPKDNYDQAILRFFEGDVPFWVCNTEKVSGMKKRESKSEAFQKAPFDYGFLYAPVGQDGNFIFQEPWYGFAASKDGDEPDYAVEFIRFLATSDEINKMAEIKGVPSIAAAATASSVYGTITDPIFLKTRVVNTGTITPAMEASWYSVTAGFAAGDYDSAESAIREFLTSIQ